LPRAEISVACQLVFFPTDPKISPSRDARAGVDSDDDETEDRSDQMTRVAATLLILAEDALERRFATRGSAEDRRFLRALGPESPSERAAAGVGGWNRRGTREKMSSKHAISRSTHRRRMALVVRLREKNALAALSQWATRAARRERELLPPLRAPR